MSKKVIKIGLIMIVISLTLSCWLIGWDIAQGEWHDVKMRLHVLIWEFCCLCCTITISKLTTASNNLYNIIHDEYKEICRVHLILHYVLKHLNNDKPKEIDDKEKAVDDKE